MSALRKLDQLQYDVQHANKPLALEITPEFLNHVKEVFQKEIDVDSDPETVRFVENFVYQHTIAQIVEKSKKYTKKQIVELLTLLKEITEIDVTRW